MAIVLDGKKLSEKSEEELKLRVSKIKEKTGVTPILATILVGDNPASAEAGLSPTKIVASIGVTPVFSLIFETLSFNSSSDFSDNFFPSSTIAIVI
mgnify:FL=1